MYPQEASVAFRKRIEEYQLERTSVGLPEIPAAELIIGILNRLDTSQYATLVRDYFDNYLVHNTSIIFCRSQNTETVTSLFPLTSPDVYQSKATAVH